MVDSIWKRKRWEERQLILTRFIFFGRGGRSTGSLQAKCRTCQKRERTPATGILPRYWSFRLTQDRTGDPGGWAVHYRCAGSIPTTRRSAGFGIIKRKPCTIVVSSIPGSESRKTAQSRTRAERTDTRWRSRPGSDGGSETRFPSFRGRGFPRIGRVRPISPRTSGHTPDDGRGLDAGKTGVVVGRVVPPRASPAGTDSARRAKAVRGRSYRQISPPEGGVPFSDPRRNRLRLVGQGG